MNKLVNCDKYAHINVHIEKVVCTKKKKQKVRYIMSHELSDKFL